MLPVQRHPGINKWPSLPADNRVDQRLITHGNRRPIERFRGEGKYNFVKHSRFLSLFLALHCYLFIFPLVVFAFGGEAVVLMPFLPQDVSSNQRLHRWMGTKSTFPRVSEGEYWPETHTLILWMGSCSTLSQEELIKKWINKIISDKTFPL